MEPYQGNLLRNPKPLQTLNDIGNATTVHG